MKAWKIKLGVAAVFLSGFVFGISCQQRNYNSLSTTAGWFSDRILSDKLAFAGASDKKTECKQNRLIASDMENYVGKDISTFRCIPGTVSLSVLPFKKNFNDETEDGFKPETNTAINLQRLRQDLRDVYHKDTPTQYILCCVRQPQ